jgi:hypothetical protein
MYWYSLYILVCLGSAEHSYSSSIYLIHHVKSSFNIGHMAVIGNWNWLIDVIQWCSFQPSIGDHPGNFSVPSWVDSFLMGNSVGISVDILVDLSLFPSSFLVILFLWSFPLVYYCGVFLWSSSPDHSPPLKIHWPTDDIWICQLLIAIVAQ